MVLYKVAKRGGVLRVWYEYKRDGFLVFVAVASFKKCREGFGLDWADKTGWLPGLDAGRGERVVYTRIKREEWPALGPNS
jgi:hypothetical protein